MVVFIVYVLGVVDDVVGIGVGVASVGAGVVLWRSFMLLSPLVLTCIMGVACVHVVVGDNTGVVGVVDICVVVVVPGSGIVRTCVVVGV